MRTEAEYREMINRSLEPRLRSLGAIPDRLLEAMLYSLTAGGKRLRPMLLLASCEMAGGDGDAFCLRAGDDPYLQPDP